MAIQGLASQSLSSVICQVIGAAESTPKIV